MARYISTPPSKYERDDIPMRRVCMRGGSSGQMRDQRELGPGERVRVRVLSTLYSLYRTRKGVTKPLAPDAEWLHPKSPDPDWNESFYFNFTCPGEGIGGWTRLGIVPNQDSDTGAMMIYAGGSRILASREEGRITTGGGRLMMGSLVHECVEPLSRWRIAFDGVMADIDDSRKIPELGPESVELKPVKVDLTFEGLAPCFNFKNADPDALAEMVVGAGTSLGDLRKVSRVSTEHYEQVGRVKGTISFDDRELPFDGRGHRDHSWGPRDWSAPRLWTWLTSQFGDDLAFNLSRVAIASVDVFNGFIMRNGVNYPVRRVELETEFEKDERTQKSLRFKVVDTSGETLEVSGRVLTVAPLILESIGHKTLVNEALAEYRCGDRTGLGIAEYLHQLG